MHSNVLRSSGNQLQVGSIDCEIQPEKEMNLYFFPIVLRNENPSFAHNLGTTGLFKWAFQQNVPF